MNENWWQFSIEPDERGEKITSGDNGSREVNSMQIDGRRLIDYGEYLGLEHLLAAQIPASKNPDERVFISTHHLFEITFKQMIFDLSVIGTTFETLAQTPNENGFYALCLSSGQENEEFWRPAVLAANRLQYSAKSVLPVFFHFLDKGENKDETFSGAEYFKFRQFLPPASGFQSAQFRLVQRAFGKGKLFKIRLFPSAEYRKNYEGKEHSPDLIEITHKVVLRDAIKIADPENDSPQAKAANLDALSHTVLTRLAQFAEPNVEHASLRLISESEITVAVEAFRRILAIHRRDQEMIDEESAATNEFDKQAVENFRADLKNVVDDENARREFLKKTRVGAFYLYQTAAKGSLAHILNQLVSTDTALFGSQENSFLSLHLKMAADRLREVQETARSMHAPEQPAGTGGGGVPYLINVRNNLIPLFPFLIAFQNVAKV